MNISKIIIITVPILCLYLLFYSKDLFKKSSTQKPNIEVFESKKPVSTSERSQTQSSINVSRRNAITEAVAKASPAVVGINVVSVKRVVYGWSRDPFWNLYFPPRVYENEVKELGSGFFISADGYIVTNEHVVQNAKKIVITTTKGEKFSVEDYWTDKVTDIALLKIKENNSPYFIMGNSDDIIVGEWAIALGNPFGLFDYNNEPSVTVGVISAKDRDFPFGEEGRIYQDMVQTDASINPGNSGGPLVNSDGEVIGINTFIFTGSDYSKGSIGLGFAIPINKIKKIIKDLEKYGKINREVYLGLHFSNISKYLTYTLKLKTDKGVLVTEKDKNSPADKAGMEIGDVVVGLNGREVNNFDDLNIIFLESDLRAGDIIELSIVRGAEKFNTKVKLEPLKK
jgi:serine protease Do